MANASAVAAKKVEQAKADAAAAKAEKEKAAAVAQAAAAPKAPTSSETKTGPKISKQRKFLLLFNALHVFLFLLYIL